MLDVCGPGFWSISFQSMSGICLRKARSSSTSTSTTSSKLALYLLKIIDGLYVSGRKFGDVPGFLLLVFRAGCGTLSDG